MRFGYRWPFSGEELVWGPLKRELLAMERKYERLLEETEGTVPKYRVKNKIK